MAKLVSGVNDLETLHPDIAAEAYGWDPAKFSPGSHKTMAWKCSHGHIFHVEIRGRTNRKQVCPHCKEKKGKRKLIPNVNDLKTLYPDLAAEAHDWDPAKFLSGSNKKMKWKCSLGHLFEQRIDARVLRGNGCPYCTNQKVLAGFNDLQSTATTFWTGVICVRSVTVSFYRSTSLFIDLKPV